MPVGTLQSAVGCRAKKALLMSPLTAPCACCLACAPHTASHSHLGPAPQTPLFTDALRHMYRIRQLTEAEWRTSRVEATWDLSGNAPACARALVRSVICCCAAARAVAALSLWVRSSSTSLRAAPTAYAPSVNQPKTPPQCCHHGVFTIWKLPVPVSMILQERGQKISTNLQHTAAGAAGSPDPCAVLQSVPAWPASPPARLPAAGAATPSPSWDWLLTAASGLSPELHAFYDLCRWRTFHHCIRLSRSRQQLSQNSCEAADTRSARFSVTSKMRMTQHAL